MSRKNTIKQIEPDNMGLGGSLNILFYIRRFILSLIIKPLYSYRLLSSRGINEKEIEHFLLEKN